MRTRTRTLIALIVALGVLAGAGSSAADSNLNYPDGSRSEAFNLGGGQHAFVFFDLAGDDDIFIHPVDFAAFLLPVTVLNTFSGFALWLDFEGINQGYLQYGVYTCTGSSGSCVFGARRGTLLL